MTPAYVDGAAGCQKGIGSAETGIKIESVTTTGEDPKMFTRDENGTRDGFVHNYDPSVTISLTGEISGGTGITASDFGSAATIANEASAKYADGATTFWGIPNTGSFFLDGSPSVTEERENLKKLSIDFLMCPDVTD